MAKKIDQNHPTLLRIKEQLADGETEYWRREALDYWQRYLRNLFMVRKLRRENRALRLLLSDYTDQDA